MSESLAMILKWRARRRFLPGLGLLVLLCLGLAIETRADETKALPPVAPENERSVPDDAPFVEACLAEWKGLVATGGWELGTALLTQSEKWGVVYRADFRMPGVELSPLVNRIMCWRTGAGQLTVGVAVGQDVSPLSLAK